VLLLLFVMTLTDSFFSWLLPAYLFSLLIFKDRNRQWVLAFLIVHMWV
jgi:hypothetical protein